MKKLQIQIPLILPEVPDEKDQCVHKLISSLQDTEGLEKVHVADKTDNGIPQLCFHYDPEKISLDRIQTLAVLTGASILDKYGHKLIEVDGIRHTRHARKIEETLTKLEGVLQAAVSASGMIGLEFETAKINEEEILKVLRKQGLDILTTEVDVERYIKNTSQDSSQPEHLHKKQDSEKEATEHDHSHGGIFGKNTELIFSIICGALLGIGFGLSYLQAVPSWISMGL